jgi:chaperonin cofactor prefoldin
LSITCYFSATLNKISWFRPCAEVKKNQQHALHEWLRQIQNICFDAEDVLDEFELQDRQKEIEKASGSTLVKVQ